MSGLTGLYGHTFVIDDTCVRRVQYQFRIVRRLPPKRWIVQLFSFLDGTPTKLAVYPENFLLCDECALYRTEEIWRVEYDKVEQRYHRLSKQGAA